MCLSVLYFKPVRVSAEWRLLREQDVSEDMKSGFLFRAKAVPAESVHSERSRTANVAQVKLSLRRSLFRLWPSNRLLENSFIVNKDVKVVIQSG